MGDICAAVQASPGARHHILEAEDAVGDEDEAQHHVDEGEGEQLQHRRFGQRQQDGVGGACIGSLPGATVQDEGAKGGRAMGGRHGGDNLSSALGPAIREGVHDNPSTGESVLHMGLENVASRAKACLLRSVAAVSHVSQVRLEHQQSGGGIATPILGDVFGDVLGLGTDPCAEHDEGGWRQPRWW